MQGFYRECCDTVIVPNQVLGEGIAIESDEGVPSWIQLTPKSASKGFAGRDGRRFSVPDANALVDQLNKRGEHLQIDIDHASEYMGPTLAYGWMTEFAVRNRSEIWAKVEWTPTGREHVASRNFRGISPTFLVERESAEAFYLDPKNAPPMIVAGLTSAALTNRPALYIRSLNSVQPTQPTKDLAMTHEQLCTALGLPPTSTPEQVSEALSAKRPMPVTDVVPRADLDAVRAQLAAFQAAETVRAANELEAARTAHASAVEAVLSEAMSSGRIPPASITFHRNACLRGTDTERSAALVDLRAYVAAAPVIVPNTAPAPRAPTPAHAPAARSKIAQQLGISESEMAAAREDMRSKPEIYPPRMFGLEG